MNKKAFLTTIPNFIEIQRASFCWFISKGIIEEFEKFSSIKSFDELTEFHFFGQQYYFRNSRHTLINSKYFNLNYTIKLFVPICVNFFIINFNSFKTYKNTILFCNLPLMTNFGTFIINGNERIVISQIIRCPGIYYKKKYLKDKILSYCVTLIPYYGSWLYFELNYNKPFLIFSSDQILKMNIIN